MSAKDLGTGKEKGITITASSNLTEEEIERATREAAQYESEDRERRGAVDARNEAEALIYQAEQVLSAKKKEMDKEKRKFIKNDLAVLQRAVKKTKPDRITPEEGEEIRAAMDILKRDLENV